jgi:hypothetical protein
VNVNLRSRGLSTACDPWDDPPTRTRKVKAAIAARIKEEKMWDTQHTSNVAEKHGDWIKHCHVRRKMAINNTKVVIGVAEMRV